MMWFDHSVSSKVPSDLLRQKLDVKFDLSRPVKRSSCRVEWMAILYSTPTVCCRQRDALGLPVSRLLLETVEKLCDIPSLIEL